VGVEELTGYADHDAKAVAAIPVGLDGQIVDETTDLDVEPFDEASFDDGEGQIDDDGRVEEREYD
jgi:hypothetical protein